MRLHPRHGQVLYALFMAFNMSGLMSLVITLFSLRHAWTLRLWALHAWPLAFSVALPVILILAPIGQKLVARLTRQP